MLNTPKIDLKARRTNSTTEGREESVSKKVGSRETLFEREMECGLCCGEGAAVLENGKSQTSTQGSVQGK